MKTNKLTLTLAAFAITFSSAAFIACGGDDSSQPGPTPRDGGTTQDSSMMMTDGGSPTDSSSDSNVGLDTGACVSDAATCNSCYSQQQAQQDPYNACSPATTNCVPFDNTRVPANVPRL